MDFSEVISDASQVKPIHILYQPINWPLDPLFEEGNSGFYDGGAQKLDFLNVPRQRNRGTSLPDNISTTELVRLRWGQRISLERQNFNLKIISKKWKRLFSGLWRLNKPDCSWWTNQHQMMISLDQSKIIVFFIFQKLFYIWKESNKSGRQF